MCRPATHYINDTAAGIGHALTGVAGTDIISPARATM
jgi:hypothetical protein